MQNIIENERFIVRAATPADLDALIHIEDEVFMDSWSRDSLSSLFDGERNVALVACQNDVMVGYITGWHVCGEAEIARLGVLHTARKQGIASALITAIVKEFEDLKVEKQLDFIKEIIGGIIGLVINYFVLNSPDAKTELIYDSPFQLLVAVILSAQCTDKRVNMTTPIFFEAFLEDQTLFFSLLLFFLFEKDNPE